MTPTPDVAAFLRRLSSDPEGSFAEAFLIGDAAGARPVTRAAFLQLLPTRAALFAQAGIAAPELAELEVTVLDDSYLVARTEWLAASDTGPVRLRSSYLLHYHEGELRIVAYLNHQGPPGATEARPA